MAFPHCGHPWYDVYMVSISVVFFFFLFFCCPIFCCTHEFTRLVFYPFWCLNAFFHSPLSSICYTARFLLVSFPFLPLPYSFSSLITRLLHYVLPLCVTMTPKSPFHIVYVYANDDYNPPALFRKDTGWSVCSSRPFTLLFKVCLPLCSCATHYILPLGLFILSAIHSDTFPTLRFEHGHQPPLLGERCEVGAGFSES